MLLLTPVRKALSLSIAVNIAAIPATLAFCGKVPLLGLAYNLVFPTLASGAVLLLLLAAAVEPIHSQTGLWLHHLNDRYTSSLMDLLHAPGRGSEGQLFAAPSPALVALVVAVLLLVGILRAQRERQKLLF